jgi:hypothetical protein
MGDRAMSFGLSRGHVRKAILHFDSSRRPAYGHLSGLRTNATRRSDEMRAQQGDPVK